MDPSAFRARRSPTSSDASAGDEADAADANPALRDADTIAARIADDELAADEARARYQAEGLPRLDETTAFASLRRPGETLHAIHEGAMFEPSATGSDGDDRLPQAGTLYLTSQRLLHTGQVPSEIELAAIEEVAVSLGRLLLIGMYDGSDHALQVRQPRLLRVQIAAAKAALRTAERDENSG